MFYPIEIEHERPGFWAWCPDIPEMKTAGDTQEDLMREAVDALETAFDFYFDDRRPVPPPPRAPCKGQALVAAKVLLHNEMLAQGVRKAELARRLNMAPPNVERIFSLRHHTKIETVELALACLGKHLTAHAI